MKSARVVLILSAVLTLVAVAAVSTPAARAAIGTCDQGNLVDVESTGGPSTGAGYATLGAAFAAINAGTHTGTVNVEICGNTAEGSATAALNASGSGAALYTAITIKPVGGAARTVSGATTAGNPLIDLNGADNVTIDGVNAGGDSLVIANTTAANTVNTSTIRFINGATSNTVTNASIQGSFTGTVVTAGGTVFFSTDTVTADGNDGNSITNCSIGPAGSNLPTKGVSGLGTTTSAAVGNNNILINNNNIFDFFGATATSAGVHVAGGNSAWTITNNRFYQTAARTWTGTTLTNRPIEVNNTTTTTGAQAMTINGNIIGYASPSGTGTYALSGSNGKFIGIYFAGLTLGAPSTISNNTIASVSVTGVTSSSTCSSTPLGGIIITGGVITSNNNTIGSQSATGSLVLSTNTTSTTEVCGIYNIGNDVWTANNNNVGGITATNAGTGSFTIYALRAFTSSGVAFNATGNTLGGSVASSIQNNATAPATARVVGLMTSAPGCNCTSNTIRNLTGAGGTGTGTNGSVVGILLSATAAGHSVQQNTIYNLSNTNGSAAVYVTGINVDSSTTLPSTVARNLIHTLTTPSPSGVINGIYVVGGLTTYQNNMIDLGNNLASGAQINGINETVAGTDNFYFNSVYIGGTGVSGSSNTFALRSAITLNARNYLDNILVNARSNGAGTGKHYAIALGGSAPNPAGLTSNSNVLYATGTGGNVGLFNGADAPTLVSWQAATGQDGASFFSDPQFMDPTGATAINLHIASGPVTVVEGNGVAIGTVTDDFDGDLRAGYTPTDIGADAGNFTGLDLAGPAIAYTPPRHTSITTDRALPITVTDASGVPTSGIGLPVLYFRKGTSGAYASNQCAFVSGSSYSCVFAYASVGGVTAGDVIQYFVAAQDGPGNVTLSPMGGAAGLTPNPPAAGTPPTIPGSFNISAPISGAKTLCPSGCDYDSLTNALGLFDRINNGALTGNTTVSILGDLTAETGAFALGAWAEDGSGGYTLTIGPSGAPRLVSGSVAAPMIKLNGADRVTFNGSLSGGTDRSLTVANTYAGSAGSVFWIASASTADGATDNTIKNCVIFGDTGSTTGAAIIAGNGTTPGGAADSPNSNNTIRNNRITRAQNGLFVSGNAAGLDQNWVIADNTIGSAVAAEKMGFRGIFVGNAQNLTISGNTINGVTLASTSTAAGIQIGSAINGGTISGNQVGDIKNTNTGGWRAYGIYLAASSTASNLTVANNVVYDIAGYGDSSLVEYNGHGIVLYAGGGYRVHHNSVRLTTDQGNGGIPAAIFITGTITTAGSLDIRDNSFATAQTTGTRYAIYIVATSAVFSDINFNDYWPGGGTLGYLGGARATLGAWQGATGRDANSLSADPLYNSPTDLRPQPGSPLLAAGTPVGLTTDILGAPRSLTAPAIGAYEHPVDNAGPTISYAAVPSTTSTLDRTFTVSATDSSGVPTSGAGLPTVYYRKGASGAYSSNQCQFVGGSDYSCTIAYAPVGGVAVGDMVQWYVAAQDSLASANVSVSPFAGAGGYTTNPPGVTTPPDPPNSYMITLGYAGSYTAGSGGAFLSLTNPGGLFEAVNAGVLTGSITVDITSDMTAETGAVALNQWIEEGTGGYTLTIRPSGAPRVISGSGGPALIKLNGADRVVFDGSLSGGTDRSLTIANTGTASPSAVIWVGSASASNGATNNTIKNCVLSGLDAVTTTAAVVAGSGTTLGGDAEAPNSNNTIRNNRIISVSNGLYLRGVATNLDQNWLVTENALGSTDRLEKLGFRGLFVGNSQNVTVSNNTIRGVVSAATSTSTITGIQLGFTISGGAVTGNTISDIKQINTLGYGCNGIYLQQTATAANVTVANNVIYDVAGYGRSGVLATNNGYGISIVSGGGYRLYHNSVSMTTDQVSASSVTAAINITSGVSTAGSLDLRDNIFANTQTVGTRYAIYCGAGANVFLDIDSNDYHPGTGSLGYLGLDRSTLAAWQGATGRDAGSILADPLFVSTTNLQPLYGSPAIAAGQPVGIATDVTGAARSLTNPTIGAYESAYPADMAVTKADDADPVTTGSYVTYTITVTNNGPADAVNPVLDDATPPDTTFVSVSAPAGWSCTAPAVGTAGTVHCAAASLAPAAPAVFALVVKVDFCLGSLPVPVTSTTNTATVGSAAPDANPANNTASETTGITDPVACNDNNDCTADTCDRALGCTYPPYAGGHACGDPSAGPCDLPDVCDGAGACQANNQPAGTPCDDTLGCTLNDQCSGTGTCAGTAKDCSDANVCTTDACLEPAGTCEYSISGACDIVGLISYYRDGVAFSEPSTKPVPGEAVLRASSLEPIETSVTGLGGTYQFLGEAGDISLTPQALLLAIETECRSAITAADAAVMARVAVHAIEPTPNQRVAGDVTGNGTVSAFDAALTAAKATSPSCLGYTLPIRTMMGSDWQFEPASKNFTPLQGGEDYGFLGVLYGDITGNWVSALLMGLAPDPVDSSIPQFQAGADTLVAPAGPRAGAPAELYLASGPARTADGHWTAVLGLQGADGILGLDLGLQPDPAVARIRSVAATGLASGFGLISNDTGEGLLISLYGVAPMQGTGEFLVVTYDLAVPVTGLPFLVPVTANEGRIPVVAGPGIPRGGTRSPDVQLDGE